MPGAGHRGASGARRPGPAGPAWHYVITPGPGSRANPAAADPLHCTARRERHAAGECGWETTRGSGAARTRSWPGLASPRVPWPAPPLPERPAGPAHPTTGKQARPTPTTARRPGPGLGDPRGAPAPPRPAALTVVLHPLGEAPLQRLVHGLQPGGDVLVPARGLVRPHQLLQGGKHLPARTSQPGRGRRAQRRRGRGATGTMSRRPRPPRRPEPARPEAGVPAAERSPERRLGNLSRGCSDPAPAASGAAALQASAPPSWRRLGGTGGARGYGAPRGPRRARSAHAHAVLARSSRPGLPPYAEPPPILRVPCCSPRPRSPQRPQQSWKNVYLCSKAGSGAAGLLLLFLGRLELPLD